MKQHEKQEKKHSHDEYNKEPAPRIALLSLHYDGNPSPFVLFHKSTISLSFCGSCVDWSSECPETTRAGILFTP